MNIQSEIVEAFFKELTKRVEIPEEFIKGLKELWYLNKLSSQKKVFELIKQVSSNGSENKKN